MKNYTLGFIFNHDLTRVLLIHKLRPEWQNGKVNGLGGKFEEGEDCYACVSREVFEESGLIISPNDWKKVAFMHSEDFWIDVLAVQYHGNETDAKTMEEERIEWFYRDSLPCNIVNNLTWLVPMCVGALEDRGVDKFETKERYYDINFRKQEEEK